VQNDNFDALIVFEDEPPRRWEALPPAIPASQRYHRDSEAAAAVPGAAEGPLAVATESKERRKRKRVEDEAKEVRNAAHPISVPVAEPEAADPSAIFKGLVIFVDPRKASKQKVQVLVRGIQENGGQVVEQPKKKQAFSKTIEGVTHVVAEENASALVLKDAKEAIGRGVRVVQLDWLSDSLSKRRLLQWRPYRLNKEKGVHSPQKKASSRRMDAYLEDSQNNHEEDDSGDDAEDRAGPAAGPSERVADATAASSPGGTGTIDGTRTVLAVRASQPNGKVRRTGQKFDHNKHIIAELDRAMKNLGASKERAESKSFRIRQLQTTMALLAYVPYPLESAQKIDEWNEEMKRDARQNSFSGKQLGVGEKTILKIKEIVLQGVLQRNVVFEEDPGVKVRRELAIVHGIGESTALKLYNNDVRSVQDLRDALAAEAAGESNPVIDFLTKGMRVGLRHYDDLQQRMSRPEAEAIRDEVIKAASTVLGKNFVEAMAAGSFRRGKETCGDVDVLIKIRKAAKKEEVMELMRVVVQPLHESGFIIDELTDHERFTKDNDHIAATWMGVVKLPGHDTCRRLDIKMYLPESYAFAMLYFTGDGEFNRGQAPNNPQLTQNNPQLTLN